MTPVVYVDLELRRAAIADAIAHAAIRAASEGADLPPAAVVTWRRAVPEREWRDLVEAARALLVLCRAIDGASAPGGPQPQDDRDAAFMRGFTEGHVAGHLQGRSQMLREVLAIVSAEVRQETLQKLRLLGAMPRAGAAERGKIPDGYSIGEVLNRDA